MGTKCLSESDDRVQYAPRVFGSPSDRLSEAFSRRLHAFCLSRKAETLIDEAFRACSNEIDSEHVAVLPGYCKEGAY
jgi:hypothetical protein